MHRGKFRSSGTVSRAGSATITESQHGFFGRGVDTRGGPHETGTGRSDAARVFQTGQRKPPRGKIKSYERDGASNIVFERTAAPAIFCMRIIRLDVCEVME